MCSISGKNPFGAVAGLGNYAYSRSIDSKQKTARRGSQEFLTLLSAAPQAVTSVASIMLLVLLVLLVSMLLLLLVRELLMLLKQLQLLEHQCYLSYKCP